MKTSAWLRLSLSTLALTLACPLSWGQAPRRAAEICFDREKAAAANRAGEDQLEQIKAECLRDAHTFAEFFVLAQRSCGAKCTPGYEKFFEGFVLSNAASFIVPGDSLDDIRTLVCRITNRESRKRLVEIAMQAIRTENDWNKLWKGLDCPNQPQSFEDSQDTYKFEARNHAFAMQLIAQSPPDTAAGAAAQLVAALQDFKRGFLPIFTPTFSALLDSALDYQKNLSVGDELPEVRARAHLIALFEDYSKSYCRPWESSAIVNPICGRILAPIQFLRTKFPPDLEVRKAMEVRVIISTLETLKRHALLQDWATYLEPVDSALRELSAYAIAGGDSAGATIAGILKLADVMEKKVGNQNLSPSEWMIRQMTSGDTDIQIAASETLKKIRLLTQEAKKDRK